MLRFESHSCVCVCVCMADAGGELRAALFLSDLHEPDGWRLVQQRGHKFRCEPNFCPDLGEGAIKVLLVCTTTISRPKYVAWHTAASSLGLRVETYPLTRYGHLEPTERMPFGDYPELGRFMRDGCLVICLDDEFESVGTQMRPYDVVAPWHLRAPGGGEACSYLFVRGESHGNAQSVGKQDRSPLGRWNTALQTRLLHLKKDAPPLHTRQAMTATRLTNDPKNKFEALLAIATGISSSKPSATKPSVAHGSVDGQGEASTAGAEEAAAATSPTLHGVEAHDPFQQMIVMDVLLRPQLSCDPTGYVTTEGKLNKKLQKTANAVKAALLTVSHLEAIVVAFPVTGADWDEMQWTPGCCGCYTSARSRVRLAPFKPPPPTPMSGAAVEAEGEAQPGGDGRGTQPGGFLVGTLHIFMRARPTPSQLQMMSLSRAADPEGDQCDYSVSELARFGLVQSAPLSSRFETLALALSRKPPQHVTIKAKAERLRVYLGLQASLRILEILEYARAELGQELSQQVHAPYAPYAPHAPPTYAPQLPPGRYTPY